MSSNGQDARRDLDDCFDAMEKVADHRGDGLLLMAVTALRQVHNLYPEADELRLRGTAQQMARIDIHNTIADVVSRYVSLLPQGEPPAPS